MLLTSIFEPKNSFEIINSKGLRKPMGLVCTYFERKPPCELRMLRRPESCKHTSLLGKQRYMPEDVTQTDRSEIKYTVTFYKWKVSLHFKSDRMKLESFSRLASHWKISYWTTRKIWLSRKHSNILWKLHIYEEIS